MPIIDGERVCLFCFEAGPSCCHSSLLAHEIERLLDVQAVHLDARRVHQADDDERLLPHGEVAEDQMEIALPPVAGARIEFVAAISAYECWLDVPG